MSKFDQNFDIHKVWSNFEISNSKFDQTLTKLWNTKSKFDQTLTKLWNTEIKVSKFEKIQKKFDQSLTKLKYKPQVSVKKSKTWHKKSWKILILPIKSDLSTNLPAAFIALVARLMFSLAALSRRLGEGDSDFSLSIEKIKQFENRISAKLWTLSETPWKLWKTIQRKIGKSSPEIERKLKNRKHTENKNKLPPLAFEFFVRVDRLVGRGHRWTVTFVCFSWWNCFCCSFCWSFCWSFSFCRNRWCHWSLRRLQRLFCWFRWGRLIIRFWYRWSSRWWWRQRWLRRQHWGVLHVLGFLASRCWKHILQNWKTISKIWIFAPWKNGNNLWKCENTSTENFQGTWKTNTQRKCKWQPVVHRFSPSESHWSTTVHRLSKLDQHQTSWRARSVLGHTLADGLPCAWHWTSEGHARPWTSPKKILPHRPIPWLEAVCAPRVKN